MTQNNQQDTYLFYGTPEGDAKAIAEQKERRVILGSFFGQAIILEVKVDYWSDEKWQKKWQDWLESERKNALKIK